jgi:hypothetical protein
LAAWPARARTSSLGRLASSRSIAAADMVPDGAP